jgi:SAM-dependent methyltransferase
MARGALRRPKQAFFEDLLVSSGLELEGCSVLELGGAEGDCGAAIKALWPTARVTIVEPTDPAAPGFTRGCELEVSWERTSLEAWLEGDAPERFDLILAFDLIEHLREPVGALSLAVQRHLEPGGQLIASFPNVDGLSRKLLGRHWMQYKPEHLIYLSRRGVEALASKVGLETRELSPLVKRLPLEYLLSVGASSGPTAPRTASRLLRRLLPNGARDFPASLRLGEWLWRASRSGSSESGRQKAAQP